MGMRFNNGHFKEITSPSVEPITLDQAKVFLKMDDTDADDALISALVTAARQSVESYTNSALIIRTFQEKYPAFAPRGLALSVSPLQDVSAVQYLTQGGSEETLSTSVYRVNTFTKPGSIYLRDGQTFPDTLSEDNAVTVTYQAGYGDASGDIPGPIISAIYLTLGELYQTRQNSVRQLPTLVENILAPYRFTWF